MPDKNEIASDIVSEIRRGDYRRFDELAHMCIYIPPEIRTPASGLGLDDDDLWQESAVALLNAIRCYDESGAASFRTYANACIQKKLVSIVRSSLRQKNIPMKDYSPLEYVDVPAPSSPESEYIEKEEYAEIRDALLSRLSPFENRVINLYLSNMSYRDMAKALSKDEKSVANALLRIRKKLRP